MADYTTQGNRLKMGLLNFSEKISRGFSKPTRRFIADMLFGMVSAKSCKLTEISRALKEPIAVKKTVERLGRNLSGFTEQQRDTVMRAYVGAVKNTIGADTMLLVDGGDAIKQCSPAMEAIGFVRDGSAGKYAPGYWTMGAVALSGENRQPIPVYENLYPCKKQGGLGTNAETAKCLERLREHFAADVPRVFDRGFDTRGNVLNLLDNGETFILRANQNRVVIYKGERALLDDVVQRTVCEYELTYTDKNRKQVNCKIGLIPVTVSSFGGKKLNLVVCKGFGKPLVLYTNLPESLESISVRVVKAYLMRWRIEEFYAFKKQGLHFEDFRVRGLISIRNLDLLLTLAIGFLGTVCENVRSETGIEIIAASKRAVKIDSFLKNTKFLFYAVLDGVSFVFRSLRRGISHFFALRPPDYQLCISGVEILG